MVSSRSSARVPEKTWDFVLEAADALGATVFGFIAIAALHEAHNIAI
jgi:uncharacterized protein (DUF1778 family)